MIFPILIFIVSLGLASMAGYMSIIGLASLFAGAFVEICILGGLMESAKLLIASWLFRFWKITPVLMKLYFSIGLIILLGITSIGIFSFFSKSYLEHKAPVAEMQYEIRLVETDIEKLDREKVSWETELVQLQQENEKAFEGVEIRKSSMETRKQPIQDRIARLEGKIKRLEDDKQRLRDQRKAMLDNYADMRSRRFVTAAKNLQEEEKPILAKIQADIDAKDAEINAVYDQMDAETAALDAINENILDVSADTVDTDTRIRELTNLIANIPARKHEFSLKKQEIENRVDLHNADLGPLIYFAQAIFAEDTEENIDRATRFLIFCLLAVFDPAAVLLLLAGQLALTRRLNNGEDGKVAKFAEKIIEKQETDDPVPITRPTLEPVQEPADGRPQLQETPVDSKPTPEPPEQPETQTPEEPDPAAALFDENETTRSDVVKEEQIITKPGQKTRIEMYRNVGVSKISNKFDEWRARHNEKMAAKIKQLGEANCQIIWKDE